MGPAPVRERRREGAAHAGGLEPFRTRLHARFPEGARLNPSNLWLSRIEKLAAIRGNSLEELLDSLELSKRSVLDQCEAGAGPGIKVLERVADHFEITLDDLIDNRIDTEWIRNPTLAPHFLADVGSRLRTSLPPLHWLEANYGRRAALNIIRFLKIPKRLLDQPDRPVRLRLLCSVLRAMRARGLSDRAFFDMGVEAFAIPENRAIHSEFAKMRSPEEIYEWFFGEAVAEFEQNYHYRIEKMRANSVILSIEPKEGRIEENGISVTADHYLSTYRWGIAAGLLRWLDRPIAITRQIQAPTAASPIEMVELSWHPNHAAFRDGLSVGSASKSSVPSLRLV